MELEAIGVLANTVVILAGGIVILVKNRKNNRSNNQRPNNQVPREKFDEQVSTCTKRFLDISREAGEVSANVKGIRKSIENIERELSSKGEVK